MNHATANHLLKSAEFKDRALARGKTPAVAQKAWQQTVDMTRLADTDEQRRSSRRNAATLSQERVRRAIRLMESGKSPALMLGKTAWNLVAELNNDGLALDDPDYIIPWVDWLHKDLRGGERRRERAAERLNLAYRQLGELATSELRPNY